jgi:energy-coupling factor transport system ATP-binding protein
LRQYRPLDEVTRMEPVIRAEHLSFSYPAGEEEHDLPLPVFEDLNLTIDPGTFVVILGHNGSGKSTLAKQFNAVLLPSGGTMWVYGINTADEERIIDVRRTVGMVFQNPDNQIVSNVVEEDVAFAPENLGVAPAEIRKRVDDALAAVDMSEYALHAPHLLSGGQKQRIAIAGVIAMQPKCIVLDEPTAMLDPQGRREVIETITRLNREQGVTVVLITHHMREAVDADRLIVMSDGRIIADGTPVEVFSQVELLDGARLTVPDTTRLLYELNQAGFDLPLSALSVEDCAQTIAQALRA